MSGRYRSDSDDLAMFRPVSGEPPNEEAAFGEVEDNEFVVADDLMAGVHRLETRLPDSLNCLYLPPSCARRGFSRTDR